MILKKHQPGERSHFSQHAIHHHIWRLVTVKICFPCVNYMACATGGVLWRLYGARGASQCGMPSRNHLPTQHTHMRTHTDKLRCFILAAPRSFSDKVAVTTRYSCEWNSGWLSAHMLLFRAVWAFVKGVKMTLTFPFTSSTTIFAAQRFSPLSTSRSSCLRTRGGGGGTLDGLATQSGQIRSDRQLISESSC